MHGMNTDEELDYRRERARKAEQEKDALAAKLAEVENERAALRESLIHACSLVRASHENDRELWAIRQTANWLGAPFSHERVQEKYEEFAGIVEQLDTALASLAVVTAERDEARAIGHDAIDKANRYMSEADAAHAESERLRGEVEKMRAVYNAAVALCAQPMLRKGSAATWDDVAQSQNEGPRLLKALIDAAGAEVLDTTLTTTKGTGTP